MQDGIYSLIDAGTQCWACPIFDYLFNIISTVSASIYKKFSFFAIIIFSIIFSFYVINAVWQNIKSSDPDPTFQKSIVSVVIKSLLILSLLGMGIIVPKLISSITFEPVTQLTLEYTKHLIPDNYQATSFYTPIQLDNNGFFNPELRDKILSLLEATVSNFQIYIKIGINIISEAFSLKALLGFGNLIKHIIICFIGIFLTYNFTKLFIKYSFCFIDVIIAMAMFAFLFPLSLILFIFKDAEHVPGWVSGLGKNLGGEQIKKLINAIVSVAISVLTYTIIMLIINGFLGANIDPNGIDYESLFNLNLQESDAMQLTIMGAIVLVYVINYIADQIPAITSKLLSVFGVSREDSLSQEMGQNVLTLTQNAFNKTKDVIKTIIKTETTTPETKTTAGKTK